MKVGVPKPPAGFPARLDAGAPERRRTDAGPARAASLPAVHRAPHAPAVPPGTDFARVRARMVERLRADGITHEAVLGAFGGLPRHRFVDPGLAAQAYEDTSLPIGFGQTISKPSVVARMLSLLAEGESARRLGSLGRVLEIGTGCGYQAALLARLGREVYSVERLRPLYDRARDNLVDLREHRIRLIYGDGRHGHPPNAPYDSIIAAAGGEELPEAWLQQLAPGGRLVAPRADPGGRSQVLVTVDRGRHGLRHGVHEAVLFVPLKSGLD